MILDEALLMVATITHVNTFWPRFDRKVTTMQRVKQILLESTWFSNLWIGQSIWKYLEFYLYFFALWNIMGGFEELLNFSVCGSASTGQEWVKNQHGARSDWGFTKSNTAVWLNLWKNAADMNVIKWRW